MIIGITGSSGAGKSTVCKLLEVKYDVIVFNADTIAKRLAKKGTSYFNDIVKEFGQEILLEDGNLNRPKLADIIYNNDEEREKLNKCTFKYVRQEIQRLINEVKCNESRISQNSSKIINNILKSKEPVIAIDAPLLFEAKLEEICDVVIAVISKNKDLQISRIVERDGINKLQAINRLNAQKPNDFYISRSKYVIINDDKFEDVEKQVNEICRKLK